MLALAAAPDIATAGDRNAPENRSDTPAPNILYALFAVAE
jgi:hypothetical protein